MPSSAGDERSPQPPGADTFGRRCQGCNKLPVLGQSFRRCGGPCALKPVYCSQECQKVHWKSHRMYCKKAPDATAPPLPKLSEQLRKFCSAHEWAFITAGVAFALRTWGDDYANQLERYAVTFFLEPNHSHLGSKQPRGPSRAFSVCGVGEVDAKKICIAEDPSTIEDEAFAPSCGVLVLPRGGEDTTQSGAASAGHPTEDPIACFRRRFRSHHKTPPHWILITTVFGVKNSAYIMVDAFARAPPRVIHPDICRTPVSDMRKELLDAIQVCVHGVNDPPSLRSLHDTCATVAVPGNFVWKPLFTDWDEYLRDPEKFDRDVPAFTAVRQQSSMSVANLIAFCTLL
ncbi:uncharacterized protein BXZ73DRAFT_74796 [Epithele typhae]|uniref:uncharacterized protein n=1 Tax=Epithele typhae TaxID=378194 RepID=UPI0020081555|nr:uncharacterized protein BXZ73DRAFT_74796 [Epithele typhae]KAH9941575.1 hypothetical protein BXZ73DRAFT_74796 [Epithele typhae]